MYFPLFTLALPCSVTDLMGMVHGLRLTWWALLAAVRESASTGYGCTSAHLSSITRLQASAPTRRKAMSGAIQAFSGETKIISTPPTQAPVGRKTKGNPSAKPLKPETHLSTESGVPLPLTGDS